MVLVGLSLVFVSLSFLLYRHPPHTWPWSWRVKSFLKTGVQHQRRSSPPKPEAELPPTTVKNDAPIPSEALTPTEREGGERQNGDRQAMPPPQPQSTVTRPLPAPSMVTSTPPSASTSPPSLLSPSFTSTLSDAPLLKDPTTTASARGPPRLASLSSTSLMPPPPRPRPTPPRLPPPTSSLAPPKIVSLAPLPTGYTPLPTSKKSRKVILSPGHSPLDWAALQSTLVSRTPLLRVTPSQLALHSGRKGRAAWTVLEGRVYDLGPYLKFHPGGEGELLRAAGKQGGKLFDEVHPWVNWKGMLGGCLVGIAVGEGDGEERSGGGLEDLD